MPVPQAGRGFSTKMRVLLKLSPSLDGQLTATDYRLQINTPHELIDFNLFFHTSRRTEISVQSPLLKTSITGSKSRSTTNPRSHSTCSVCITLKSYTVAAPLRCYQAQQRQSGVSSCDTRYGYIPYQRKKCEEHVHFEI